MSTYVKILKDKLTSLADGFRILQGTTNKYTLDEMTELVKNGSMNNTPNDLGNKLYSFGAIADVHASYGNGDVDLSRAITKLQEEGAEFICHAGDIGQSGTVTELEKYKNIVEQNATIPIYSCTGNHDKPFTNENWRTYVGHDLNYIFEKDNDVFIILSLATTNGTSSTDYAPYGEENLAWLETQLSLYAGRRIFIFTHYPLSGYSGLRPETYYGFSELSNEDEKILSLMNSTKNVMHFSGHTHFYAEVEEAYDNINFVFMNFNNCGIIHIPSAGYPRSADNTPDYYGSQGYLVNVYENGVVLKTIDFVTSNYVEGFEYFMPIKNSNIEVKNNVINVNKTSINVNEGKTQTFSIALSNPVNVDTVVSLSVDNGNITLDKTELMFTASNYDVEQIVTITAIDDEILEDVFSVITVSAANMATKLLSITIVDNDQTTEGGETTNYTNQIPLSVDYNGSVYNNKGYKEDTRASISSTKVASGIDCTGFIPCQSGDIIYTKNLADTSLYEKSYVGLFFFDEAFNNLGSVGLSVILDLDSLPDGIKIDEYGALTMFPIDRAKDYYTIQVTDEKLPLIRYVRINSSGITDNSVVTINEPIE